MNLTHCATHGRSCKSESPTHGGTTLYFRPVSRIHETGLTLLKMSPPAGETGDTRGSGKNSAR